MTISKTMTADGQPCEGKKKLLLWQKEGRSFTQSGYGARIPTVHMVRLSGSRRWRRVYCCIYGNSGFCFVDGPKLPDGTRGRILIDS